MKRTTMAVLLAIASSVGCGSKDETKGKAAQEPERNWWCNAAVCERTREKCLERGQGRSPEQAACMAHDTALCASLRDKALGPFEMCFPDLKACMHMIEITELAYSMEIEKVRELKPEEKFKRLEPKDEIRCKDRS